MRFEFELDAAPLQLAYNMAKQTGVAARRNAIEEWANKLAVATAAEFDKLVFARARTKQGSQRLWHMFKANRIGIVGAELYRSRMFKSSTKDGHAAQLSYTFTPNSEQLRNIPSGRLRSYERDGVKGVYGDKRLGIAGTKYSQRKGYRFRDKRDPAKTYTWASQAADVEFGRKITVRPTSGKWLAVATGDRGVIFAKRRVIDYSNWNDNGYLGFLSLWEEFSMKRADKIERELEERMVDKAYDIADTLPKEAQTRYNERLDMSGNVKGLRAKSTMRVNFATPQMLKKQEKVIKEIMER